MSRDKHGVNVSNLRKSYAVTNRVGVGVHLPFQTVTKLTLAASDDTAAVTVRWRKRKRKEAMMMMTCS